MAHWTEDSKGENLARELKIELSPVNQQYPLSKINIGAGLRNQARIEAPIIQAIVDLYVRVLDNGGSLPAVFTTADGNPWAGNHRIAAAIKKGFRTIGVYIMTPPKGDKHRTALESFKRRDNVHHGNRISRDECFIHAVTMAKSPHFAPPSKAAKDYNLKLHEVNQAIRADKAQILVRKNKIDVDWSRGTFDDLNSIGDDKIEIAVARLAARHDISQSGVGDLIKDVKVKRTSDARLRVVDRWADEISRANQTTSGTAHKPSRSRKKTQRERDRDRAKLEFLGPRGFRAFLCHGNKAASGGAFKTLAEMGVTDPSEVANMTQSINQLIQTLTTIRGRKSKK